MCEREPIVIPYVSLAHVHNSIPTTQWKLKRENIIIFCECVCVFGVTVESVGLSEIFLFSAWISIFGFDVATSTKLPIRFTCTSLLKDTRGPLQLSFVCGRGCMVFGWLLGSIAWHKILPSIFYCIGNIQNEKRLFFLSNLKLKLCIKMNQNIYKILTRQVNSFNDLEFS